MNDIKFRFAISLMILISVFVVGGGVVSAAVTTIDLTSPVGGEDWSGDQNITWSVATDGDGEPTSTEYDVAYSQDGGVNWVNIEQGVSRGERSWIWDTTSYDESSNALIRVKDFFSGILGLSNIFEVDNTVPSVIDDLVATAVANGNIQLEWTATGDDDGIGTAINYVVKYSDSEITTQEEFDSATLYLQSWTPLESGNSENKILTGFTDGQIYYFAIEAVDNAENQGGLYNSPSATSDATSPTVELSYSDADEIVKSGDALTITAIFSEDMKDSPTPQIAIDYEGSACDLSMDMTKVSDIQYTYEITVPSDFACDGTAIVTITAKDIAGNDVSTITNNDFVVDNTKPTVALTYSANPAKAGIMTVTATYSEAIVGTSAISIDQQGSTDISGASMTSGDQTVWTYDYAVTTEDGSNYIDGTATVSLSAIADAAGNDAANPTENTFVIDTNSPSINNFNSPAVNAVYITDVPLTFTATDVNLGTCSYAINGGDSIEVGCTGEGRTISVSNLVDGRNTLVLTADDLAGNTISADSVSFVYNNDNTLTVGATGADFTTIQDAIGGATASDTINVADGTYIITSAINVNKGVTITGNVANPASVLVKYSSASSALNCVEVNSADVTIQGIKVQGCKNGFHFDKNVNTNTGVTISNCIIEDVSGWGIGEISSPNTVISHNTITNAGDKGIYFKYCEGTSESNRCEAISNVISGCREPAIQTYFSKYAYIYDNTISSTNDKGINIIKSGATGTADRIQVIGNTISQTKYPGIQVIGSPYTYVHDNILTKCNYYGADSTGDWDYASIHVEDDGAVSGANVIIDSNTMSDGINGIQTWSDDTTITNNEIYDMGKTYADTKGTAGVGDGIYYNSGIIVGTNWLTENIKPTGTQITGNSIYNNYHGLYVRNYATLSSGDPSVLSVTAEKNYWNSANGPTHSSNTYNVGSQGDKVSDNVDFTPWYDTDKTGTSFGPVHNTDSGEWFLTIQEAIDDDATLNGHVINVSEGTYTENVVIDKNITLQSSGATADTTIDAFNPSDYVVKITADGVTLDGFTITGMANGGENKAAVITWGVDSCTITNNILTDNYKDAINLFSIGSAYSDYNTVSNNVINAPNNHGDTYGIKIKGSYNNISDNEIYNADTSIHIWSDDASETASPDYNIISDNTIAQGTGDANHKYGIEIKTGQHNEVTGNTISVTRAGIHFYTSHVMAGETNFDPRPASNTISDNTITGGEAGIVLLEGANNNTISGNTISGTTIAGILGSLSRDIATDWAGVADSPSSYLVETPQQYLQITGNTFKDNTLDNCGHGIAMEYADNNIIGQSGHGNTIKDNTDTVAIDYNGVAFTADYAGIYFDANSESNIVNYNNITGNTGGLKNANTATTLDAENNWWGYVTGPHHSTNSDGQGNDVSDNVLIKPWSINEQHDTDLIAPTSEITFPSAGSWQNQDFTAEFSYSDTGESGLKKCKYKVVSSDGITKSYNAGNCDCSGDSILISKLITVGLEQNCRDEGTNICKVVIKAFDNANNEGTEFSGTFSIDWTAPTDGSVSYTDGYETGTTATVTVSEGSDGVSGIASVQLYKKEATLTGGLCTCGDYGNWEAEGTQTAGTTTSVEVATTSGKCYMFKYESTNEAGLTAIYTSANELKVDADVPITTDSGIDTNWHNSDVTVTLNPTDSDSGVANTYYCVDQTNNCNPIISGISVLVNTEGVNYVRYYSTDVAGNSESVKSATNTVKIDKSNPDTNDDYGDKNGNWQGQDQTITLTPSDVGDSEIASTKYCTDTTDICNPDTNYIGAVTISTEGTNYFRYASTDSAGNVQDTISRIVKIDKTNPAITPITGNVTTEINNAVQISATVTDSGSNIKEVKLYYTVAGESEQSESMIGTSTYTATIPAQSNNVTITYYVTATDNVDNTETSSTYIVTVHDLIWDLSNDWNLVSVPKDLITNTTNTLLIGSAVWEYKDTGWDRPDKLKAGVGYWVDNANKTELGLDYALESAGGSIPTGRIKIDDLSSGWNLIGLTTTETKTVREVFCSGLNLTIVDTCLKVFDIVSYNEAEDKFVDLNDADDSMNPGVGYWVYILS